MRKEPEIPSGRSKKPYQPTAKEKEQFAFFWEHLRQNKQYVQLWESFDACRQRRAALEQEGKVERAKLKAELDVKSKELAKLPREPGKLVYVGSMPVETSAEEQFRTATGEHMELLLQANGCGLPIPIDPKIEETASVIQQVVHEQPDYFQDDLWQGASLRNLAGVVIWNRAGELGCAWGGGPVDRGFANANAPLGVWEQFGTLLMELQSCEKMVLSPELVAAEARELGATVEERSVEWQRRFETAKEKMRAFLSAHPRMDFVINSAVTWETMITALRQQWDWIQKLRADFGLTNERLPVLPKAWRKHLKVWGKVKKFGKPGPDGKIEFDNLLLKKIFPTEIGKLNWSGLPKSGPEYKGAVDRLRSQSIYAYDEVEKRIVNACPS